MIDALSRLYRQIFSRIDENDQHSSAKTKTLRFSEMLE